MNQLQNILVAVDFSPCSKAALAQAVRIAGWNHARLHVLHVVEPLVIADLAWSTHESRPDADELVHRKAQNRLTAWIKETGGEAEASVVVGSPLHEVLTKARSVSADLLVAGARGSTAPIQGAGTLAAMLARKAPTMVLLVNEGGPEPFRKVVAGVDFSPASGLAIEQAKQVARWETGEIHCLHVFNPPWNQQHYLMPTPEAPPDFKQQYTAALQGRLDEFVDRHEGTGMRRVLFPWSSNGKGIAQYARDAGADLIIVSTKGHTALRYLLLGSTAERLLRELPCSVLTVPPSDPRSVLPIP